MQELLKVMQTLRGPQGCPWDKEQTHLTLRPYLLEEAAEAVDAITQGDMQELRSELGDVLLQVAFHSVLAQEEGEFSYADVERSIVDKMVRRHPHVFGNVQASSSAEVKHNWQSIKAQEHTGKSPRTLAQQIPAALGALAREQQRQKLSADPVQHAPNTERAITEQMLGEQLSDLVQRAQASGLDAEQVLRDYTNTKLQQAERQREKDVH